MVALITQILEIRFWPSGKSRIREELIRVLRWLNNRGLLPLTEKTALRRNRPISSRKLQDAKLEHVRSRSVLSHPAPATLSRGARNGIAAGKK